MSDPKTLLPTFLRPLFDPVPPLTLSNPQPRTTTTEPQPRSTPASWPTRDAYYGPENPTAPLPTGGGFLGGGLWSPAHPAGEPRGRAALDALAPPPADHPMMRDAQRIRAELAADKLPTDANGVRVVILGEQAPLVGQPADHGPSIARTVAGPAGLAQGARVELPDPAIVVVPPGGRDQALERMKRGFAASSGQAGFADTMRAGIDRLEAEVTQAKAEIDGLTARTPKGGQTTVASLSRGESATRVGLDLANAAIAKGNDSPLVKEANAARQAAGVAPLDVTKEADAQKFRGEIIMNLTRHSQQGEGKTRLDAARASLGESVAKAREHGIVMFAASGNEHAPGNQIPGADRSSLAGTPGLIMVGASDVRDPTNKTDDRMSDFSGSGAQLTAPGVRMPVGAPDGKPTPGSKPAPVDIEGTSFSAPYAASVAALMVRANPQITPAQIESILTKTARDDTTTDRDGAGMIDVAAAVRAARALAP